MDTLELNDPTSYTAQNIDQSSIAMPVSLYLDKACNLAIGNILW